MSHPCGHILSFFLFFSFSEVLACCFIEGAAKRELSVCPQCLVCHGHPHAYALQRRAGSANPRAKSFPEDMAKDMFPLCLFSYVEAVKSGGKSRLQVSE